MKLDFRQTIMDDAGLLVDIYNASFSAIISGSGHVRDMERPSK